MFYPVDSLKRGGRFYLCWVADSWPLRFATITHRQLWTQDIRRICDDLLEVMTNESGRPANRFSLRLSSQLMRGLVRLYQKKVTIFLGDLCMINATVTKNVNKKWCIHEAVVVDAVERPRLPQLSRVMIQEEPEVDQRVEDLIQNSGNVVTNVQDITLKEAAIPEFQLPPNDGFGEENPEQALQLLADRTMEQMMQGETSAAQYSGLELLGLDSTDKSHDNRLAPHDTAQMERISEHDITMFRKSTAEELMPASEFEKDIPEIPEIPQPDLPAPPPEKPIEQEIQIEQPAPPQEPVTEAPRQPEVEEIELEELEEEPQAKRRRLKKKIIIDKKNKISANVLRTRIANNAVELRCEDSSDDIVEIRVPVEVYMRRPCHAGHKFNSYIASEMSRLFMRNLGVVSKQPLAEREAEEALGETSRRGYRSVLDKIVEEEEPSTVQPPPAQLETTANKSIEENVFNITEPPPMADQVQVEQPDISDLLTQKVETLSQQARKRKSTCEISPKRPKLGYVSFRRSQQLAAETIEMPVIANEIDKENVPGPEYQQSRTTERNITTMLQESGLADLQMRHLVDNIPEPPQATKRPSRRDGSESSETPLGSLDRTKVSLGDSDKTTDSKKFIRDQWGTEGTMIKILSSVKDGLNPLTVQNLIAKGPLMSGHKRIIVARCFTSILKLKQHGFIRIEKDSETLEIQDITLGPKFDL